MSNSVWFVGEGCSMQRESPKNPQAVEYVPAQHYNELIDWVGEHKHCAWNENEAGAWETECGNLFEFVDGGPSNNGAIFCQYCGSKIEAGRDQAA